MNDFMKCNTRIIAGHSGSGKTEFALNYALRMHDAGIPVAVADLDVVNPFFRSREAAKPFAEKGIRIISSNLKDNIHEDTPAMAAEIGMCFQPGERLNVIDVGGNPNGAVSLGQFAWRLRDRPYDMWMVVNANRPQTTTAGDVIGFLKSIERVSSLCFTGLINTTHMLGKTTVADIARGDALVREVSGETGLPVVYTVYLNRLSPEIAAESFAGEPFPMEMIMRPSWLR